MEESEVPEEMLPFQLEFGRYDASMRIQSVVDKQFGVYLWGFDGIRFDNRFIPPSWKPDPRWHLLLYIAKGSFSFDGETFEAGEALSASTETPAPGPYPAAHTMSHGDRAAILAIRLRPPVVREEWRTRMRRLPSDVRTLPWGELMATLEDPARSVDKLPFSFNRVFDGLRGLGVVDPSIQSPCQELTGPGRVVSRIASTVFPTLSRLATRPTMVDLISRAQLTERQLLRNLLRVQEDFELFDRGWRPAILRWRVTAGALLLSNPQISLTEAAKLAGYSSVKAMARAFSDSGLPPPSEVRERIGRTPAPAPAVS